MKTYTINTTALNPGTIPHVRQILRRKHGKEVTILYRAGGDVTYMV